MQDIIIFINHHPLLTIAAAILFISLFIVEFIRNKRSTFNLSPADATRLINYQNAVVIDVRPKEAYRKGHIVNAYSMTIDDIKNSPKKIEKFKNKPIILVCGTGQESPKIAAALLKQGYNTYSLAGGMRAWSNADMPLVRE